MTTAIKHLITSLINAGGSALATSTFLTIFYDRPWLISFLWCWLIVFAYVYTMAHRVKEKIDERFI